MAGEPAFADPCCSRQEEKVAAPRGQFSVLFEAAQSGLTTHAARLLYFALHPVSDPGRFGNHGSSLGELALVVRMRILRAIRVNPYCIAQTVIVSIPVIRTGRFLSFDELMKERKDKNEKARYAVPDAR